MEVSIVGNKLDVLLDPQVVDEKNIQNDLNNDKILQTTTDPIIETNKDNLQIEIEPVSDSQKDPLLSIPDKHNLEFEQKPNISSEHLPQSNDNIQPPSTSDMITNEVPSNILSKKTRSKKSKKFKTESIDKREKMFIKLTKKNSKYYHISTILPNGQVIPVEGLPTQKVRLSSKNKASQISIGDDMLTAVGEKGYRMIRATHYITKGQYYYEININQHTGHTRLGWSTDNGDLQAPCGYDRFSYSYRDIQGTMFHQSSGKPYGDSYGPGDIIGCYMDLLDGDAEGVGTNSSKTLKLVKNSKIIFWKNGIYQGVAASNIFAGKYFPAVSLYMGASVTFNFGENRFKYPPNQSKYPWKSISSLGLIQNDTEKNIEEKTTDSNVIIKEEEVKKNSSPSSSQQIQIVFNKDSISSLT